MMALFSPKIILIFKNVLNSLNDGYSFKFLETLNGDGWEQTNKECPFP